MKQKSPLDIGFYCMYLVLRWLCCGYESLVGMAGGNEAKGMTTTYEYDSFQRLKTIKDQDGNIVESYDYHYKP